MRYFIDTNLIIDSFERKNEKSLNKLKSILEDDANEIFYNGLVYTDYNSKTQQFRDYYK